MPRGNCTTHEPDHAHPLRFSERRGILPLGMKRYTATPGGTEIRELLTDTKGEQWGYERVVFDSRLLYDRVKCVNGAREEMTRRTT